MDLGMDTTCGDLSFFFKRSEVGLEGLSRVVVDDTIQCVTDQFLDHTRQTMDRFKSKERVMDNVVFAGIHIRQEGGEAMLTQESYALKLKKMDEAADYKAFRSVRAKLAWLVNSRPEICCAVAKLAQVREGDYGVENVKAANQVIKYVLNNAEKGIAIPKLDMNTLSIEVYTDASLANNSDLSSQLGYVIALRHVNGNCNIVDYSSRKCRRVTHSSLAGEILAFTAGFDAAFILKHDLHHILGKRIQLIMKTDS